MSTTIRERFALYNYPNERWHFFQVDKPQQGRWQGYTFLKEQCGDNLRSIKDRTMREQVLKHFDADRETLLANYGKLSQRCGLCGMTLTDPDSRTRGIGPVCAKNL